MSPLTAASRQGTGSPTVPACCAPGSCLGLCLPVAQEGPTDTAGLPAAARDDVRWRGTQPRRREQARSKASQDQPALYFTAERHQRHAQDTCPLLLPLCRQSQSCDSHGHRQGSPLNKPLNMKTCRFMENNTPRVWKDPTSKAASGRTAGSQGRRVCAQEAVGKGRGERELLGAGLP